MTLSALKRRALALLLVAGAAVAAPALAAEPKVGDAVTIGGRACQILATDDFAVLCSSGFGVWQDKAAIDAPATAPSSAASATDTGAAK